MLKIGHRGAKGYVAENTLASFEKALELNVDAIELDVHLSSDGKILVIHDETIYQTTSNPEVSGGFVKDYTSTELKELGVPTLEEVLILINQKSIINIEIKDADVTKYVLDIIHKYVFDKNWNSNLFQISSFYWDVLEICSLEDSQISLGVLTEESIENAIAFAKKINAYSINPYFKLLTTENVKSIHENGFKIYPWTVNSEEDITFVKSLQVDGIISDFPDRI